MGCACRSTEASCGGQHVGCCVGSAARQIIRGRCKASASACTAMLSPHARCCIRWMLTHGSLWWLFIVALQTSSKRLRHMCVGFVSNLCRICVGFVWNLCRFVSDLCRCESDLCRSCVKFVSDVCRICVGFVSNLFRFAQICIHLGLVGLICSRKAHV